MELTELYNSTKEVTDPPGLLRHQLQYSLELRNNHTQTNLSRVLQYMQLLEYSINTSIQ